MTYEEALQEAREKGGCVIVDLHWIEDSTGHLEQVFATAQGAIPEGWEEVEVEESEKYA